MSTTSYQTNAKPRSRRGSHGETSEKGRSRASSSASSRLSKTLSRTFDEIAVPRNSRPSSPAIRYHRPRTLDATSSDQYATSGRHSTSSVTSTKSVRAMHDPEAMLALAPAAKLKPQVVQSFDDEHGQPNNPVAVEDLVSQSALPGALEVKRLGTETRETAPAQPPTGIPSSRFPFMQPTVAEEAEENLVRPASSVPPQMIVSTSPTAAVTTPSAIVTRNGMAEDIACSSPRISETFLQEPSFAQVATVSAPSSSNPLLAPHPKGSVTFIQPSLAERLPESGGGDASSAIMASPRLVDGATIPQVPLPTACSPLASPMQSPMLQHVGSPPPQPFLYSYPYALPFMASPTFRPGIYLPPFTSPNAPFIPAEGIPRSGSAGAEDERVKLLEKVSSVLPDIDRLLQYYRETQGLLSEKNHLVRQAETQREEEVTRLRVELSATKEEYERIIGDQATENVKLKGEVTERNEKIAVLEAASAEVSSLREQLAKVRQDFEWLEQNAGRNKQLNEQLTIEKHALEEMVERLKKQAADEQAVQTRTLEALKAAHQKQLFEKEQECAKAHADHKSGLSKVQLDLAGMIKNHNQQKKDLESARGIVSEQELLLADKAKELTDALRAHQDELQAMTKAAAENDERQKQEIEKMRQELSELKSKHEEEARVLRESQQQEAEKLQQAAEARLAEAEAEHARCEDRLQDELNTTRSRVEAASTEVTKEREVLDNLKTELANSRKAHKTLASQHEMTRKHYAELAESMRNLKDRQAEWHRESERMDRLVQGFGQLVSSKNRSKGDQFFVGAFNHLACLIGELSKHPFQSGLNNVANRHVYQKLGLPDTYASGAPEATKVLRSLVVQNHVWSIIQRRIFEPFLFTAAYVEDEDDDGLERGLALVSQTIRGKSLRREAIWRTITMRAMYASPGGSKAARIVATRLSREIMDTIGPRHVDELRPALLQAVRFVAKAAVQLWRLARLEWDLIQSSMQSNTETWREIYGPPEVLLWVRPHIVREAVPRGTIESQLQAGSLQHTTKMSTSCIYLQGTALLQRGSPLVQARLGEVLAGAEG